MTASVSSRPRRTRGSCFPLPSSVLLACREYVALARARGLQVSFVLPAVAAALACATFTQRASHWEPSVSLDVVLLISFLAIAASPATLAAIASAEYVAHGHSALAVPLAQRTLDWYRALPVDSQPRWSDDVVKTLLFAGRWQVAVSWAATAAILALASLAVIGTQGLSDYLSLLNEAQRVPNNRYFTLAYVLGPETLGYVAQGVVVVAASAAAYINRHASHARIFALGLVATTLGATYWHLQDFTILVLAAWLFWRTDPPAWQRWWLLVIVLAAEFAWPLTPLPLLVGVTVWFAILIVPRKTTSTVAA